MNVLASNKKTIAVDLDGVLADYRDGWKGVDQIGDPLPGAVEFTYDLGKLGNVLIFTTRCSTDSQTHTAKELRDIVKSYLDKHGFYYNDIWIGSGKPKCAAYVDDRAVSCDPSGMNAPPGSSLIGSTYQTALSECRNLVGITHTKLPQ